MCGISGIICFRKSEFNLLELNFEMNRRIRHRGPDGEGFAAFSEKEHIVLGSADTPSANWNQDFPYSPVYSIKESLPLDPQAVLGHRRLSIIDLSAEGHQPMTDKNGRYWIIFNGEVYNYKEIRSQLEALGHSFYSHTDTEVVLHAFIQWGAECVHKFIGMWAFAIYDRTEQKLFASRDRIGVKPFYYTVSKGHFAFASEIKALISLPFLQKQLNDVAIYDYLVLGKCEVEEESIFKGVYELLPGYNLEQKLSGELTKWSYYSPQVNTLWEDYDEGRNRQFVSRLRELLKDSIDLHLRSDVSVGACLSGGLDSSVITALASAQMPGLPVFTVTSTGDKEDESAWAKQVVDRLNLEWHTTNPGPADLLKHFEELMYCQDLPALSANTYTHFELMRLVRQSGVKVTIDGQGADELFAGYTQYYAAYLIDVLKHGSFKELLKAIKIRGNDFANKRTALMIPLKNLVTGLMGEQLTAKAFRRSHPEFELIRDDFWSTYKDRISLLREKILSDLNNTLIRDYHGNSLKTMLRAADRNSMHFSIESRVPFSDDYRLEEFAFGIPAVYKVRNNLGKSVLRDAATAWLPQEVCYRKDKKGFSIPEKRWMIEMGEEVLSYFTKGMDPYLDVKLIKKQWSKHLQHTSNTGRLWRLLCLSVWMGTWTGK